MSETEDKGWVFPGKRLVHLTAEAHAAVRRAATGDFVFPDDGIQRPDGSWDVPLSEHTIWQVESQSLPGESLSETILRWFSKRH